MRYALSAAILALALTACSSDDEGGDDEATPSESTSPYFADPAQTDPALLVEAAGIPFCSDPIVPQNASLAVKQLTCWMSGPKYTTARVYGSDIDRSLDLDLFRDNRGFDKRDGRPLTGYLVSDGATDIWVLGMPEKYLAQAQAALGGTVLE